jgi:hypothetical protein
MKPFLQLMILAAAFSSMAAMSSDMASVNIKHIAESRPCKPGHISVFGYLHASRHGAWVSDDPGINGKGIPIRLAEFASPERKRLLNYIYRPQENMSHTFSAVFTGPTSCNENGVPVLRVQKIERIEIAPIRDAG